MTTGEIVFACVLLVGAVVFTVGLIRAACILGKAAGALVGLVLDEVEIREPREFKVKPRERLVFPVNCPGCGTLMMHIICPKCGAWLGELGRCPQCRTRVKAVSCPSCRAVIRQ